MPLAERIQRLAPEATRAGVAPAAQEVTVCFSSLEIAPWGMGARCYGIGDHHAVLTPGKWLAIEALTRQLETHRHPLASDTQHRLYCTQPERWLVGAELPRIDARLDPRHVYTQDPAFSSGNRVIIDLPGVT
jgi:hypothetical protein